MTFRRERSPFPPGGQRAILWPSYTIIQSRQGGARTLMSIPLLVGLLVLLVLVGAVAGVWRARGRGGASVQSSIMMLLLAVVAALLVLFLFRGRF